MLRGVLREKAEPTASVSTAKILRILNRGQSRAGSERALRGLFVQIGWGYLAANANGAEAEDHVATRRRAAEAHHWAKAREEQHLIELVAQVETLRPGQDLVSDHLAVLIDGDVQEQAVWQRQLEVMLLRRPGLRVVRKGDELRRT